MIQFSKEYSGVPFMQLLTADLQSIDNQNDTILQLLTAELEGLTPELFFGIGFTQHMMLLSKCKDWKQRIFYIKKTVENHWTVEMLEWQIKTNLFQKQGSTIQSNFESILPIPPQLNSTLAFKDEYLLDYINVETSDERVFEKGIVNNIKEFIMKMGKGFSFIGNQHRLLVDESERRSG